MEVHPRRLGQATTPVPATTKIRSGASLATVNRSMTRALCRAPRTLTIARPTVMETTISARVSPVLAPGQ